MKRTILGLLIIAGFAWSVQAQEETRFTVEVSTDSILFGNYFKVTFTLENAKDAEFSGPDFSEFQVISGPNMASSMSIINGTVTQSVSYSYYLEPKEVGNFYILPASVDLNGRMLETQPLEVMVVPNPEGIKQSPEPRNGFRMDGFGFDNFDLRNDEMPGLDRMNDMLRRMIPEGNMDGFRLFQDSLPSFDLEEFFRMMPDMQMEIPDELREVPKDSTRKKKRRIYKI